MVNKTPLRPIERTSASFIDDMMTKTPCSNEELADTFDTTAEVIAAIRAGTLPVPLAWVPRIAYAIGFDNGSLMRMALDEQWFDSIMAIARTLVWEQGEIERDLLDFFAELNHGQVPDVDDGSRHWERIQNMFRA